MKEFGQTFEKYLLITDGYGLTIKLLSLQLVCSLPLEFKAKYLQRVALYKSASFYSKWNKFSGEIELKNYSQEAASDKCYIE